MFTLAQMSDSQAAAAGGIGAGVLLFQLIIAVFYIVVSWKIFAKAGKPGWACIIPIYNIIVMLEIAGKPLWWIILMFIPVANIIVAILTMIGLAQNFGKGTGFGIGLVFLGFIFGPILAFGSATYQPSGEGATA